MKPSYILKIKIIAFALSLFLGAPLLAAPAPATSTSALIATELGLFRSHLGFKIDAADTDWELIPSPKNHPFVITQFMSPNSFKNIHASLTVRREKLIKKQKLSQYVKKWLNQYPRFGFDVTGSKKFKIKGHQGYVIDVTSRDRKKQLRQVVYLKKKDAFVLTCRDHKENFKNSLKACNKIIRSFEWTTE